MNLIQYLQTATYPHTGTPIIAFLGDSVTHGAFECIQGDSAGCIFDMDAVYHERLRRMLLAVNPWLPVSIINAGVAGDNAIMGLARLERDVISHKPHICVVNFCLNDLSETVEEYVAALREIFTRLMAADILLYQPDLVPVGEDQKQHVELTHTIARRFNGIYGDVFKIPEPFVPKVGARIMSLTNPTAKMSKSENEDTGRVLVMDTPETIMRQFKRAITDSDTENCVRYDKENKPGVANLMTIYSACTGKSYEQIEQEFAGQGYGAFKPKVGEAVVETLRPIREEAERLIKDKAYLESVYRTGAEKASYVAEKTLRKVYKKVGFLAR